MWRSCCGGGVVNGKAETVGGGRRGGWSEKNGGQDERGGLVKWGLG